MATLTGNLKDVTSSSPKGVVRAIVKAPSFRVGTGKDIITTSSAEVDLDRSSGEVTISKVYAGLSWLYLEGEGWSDSIPLVVADGMTTLVEAVANASGAPGILDYLKLLSNAENRIQDYVDGLQADTFGGYQTAEVSLDTLLAGGTNTNTRVYYSVASGEDRPGGVDGLLDVTNFNYRYLQVFYGTDGAVWQRKITDRRHISEGSWAIEEWKRTDSDTLGVIASNANLDDMKKPGVWVVTWSDSSIAGLPIIKPGVLTVHDVQNSTGKIFLQKFMSTNPAEIWIRESITSGRWQEWRKVGMEDVTRMGPGDARRAAIVDAGLARRGRLIGTGGKCAIALRFDHHLDHFGAKVLPLLKKYRLPWGQMLNAGNVGKRDDNWAFSKIARECHSSGGEVWNHSYSHSNVTYYAAADREVSLGLKRLQENLPSLWIDSWAGPGQPTLMGMEGMETPERFYATYPGQLVLAQHAFVRGYYPGVYQPLAGPNLIGAPHMTLDKQSASWCESFIRGAISAQAGATLMLHPNYLDQPGYMTSSDLDQVLSYIATKRDQGELVVLSNVGVLMADSARPDVLNLLNENGEGSISGNWSEVPSVRGTQAYYGVPHEAVVWLDGTGPATLTVKIDSPTYPVTVSHETTLDGETRLGVVVTPPLDTTKTTVSITGTGTHKGVRYRPI